MAEKKALVVYAAAYETVEAALADLDAIEQLHKDELIGQYDAAVIEQDGGEARIARRIDRPRIRVVPEWFGGGTLPRKELHQAAAELTAHQAGLIAVGEPTIEKGLDKAFTSAARVVKRAVNATTDEVTSELQEALREADMSATEARPSVDMHFEVDVIPVSDIDRAKQFYKRLGWRYDDDDSPLEGLRIVQFTPPGSAASVTFGQGLTPAAPGSAVGNLTVSDIETAYDDIVSRGIDAVPIWHGPPLPPEARQPGPDPDRTSYGSFCSFSDPDGNTWIVQEVTSRRTLPTAKALAG